MARNKKKGEINKKAMKPKKILYNKCQTLIVVFNLKKPKVSIKFIKLIKLQMKCNLLKIDRISN